MKRKKNKDGVEDYATKEKHLFPFFFKYFVLLLQYKQIQIENMNTTAIRKPTSFRLPQDLLEALKERAKASNRSLNNYVESALLQLVYHEPNETTIEAMNEALSGKELESL